MKGGEEERWGGEERSVSVECRVVVLLTFLRLCVIIPRIRPRTDLEPT